MHPILFHSGQVTIYSYGVLVASGVLLGLWYARRQAPRLGLDPEKVWNLGLYLVLSALVVAKIWLVLSAWSYYAANPREIISTAVFQSGGTFYGGVVGAVAMILAYTYVQKMPLLSVMDCYAAAIPLGHSIGRLGCFFAGCCFGKPTALPWAVVFTSPAAARLAGTPLGIPLHPTELYESAAEFLNFLFIAWLGKRQSFSGQMIGTYFILYGVARGIIEFFRGDPGRTMMFHDSISLMQISSVLLILAGSFLWWRGLRGLSHRGGARPAAATGD